MSFIVLILVFSIAWMWNRGYVAVSGTNGVVRIMLLNLDPGNFLLILKYLFLLDKEKLTTVTPSAPWYSSFQMTGHESSSIFFLSF